MDNKPSKQDIIAAIHATFPLYPLPQRITDSYAGGPEGHYVDQIFTGKAWNDLNYESIREQYNDGPPYNALFHLCPEAWAYYLPIYLLASLNGNDAEDISGTIIRGFLIPKHPTDKQEPLGFSRTKELTHQQKRVITSYLEHFKDKTLNYTRESIEYALNTYWHQFATPQPEAG